MKTLLLGALALALIALGGCAAFQSIGTELDNAASGVVSFIDAPATQEAAATLKSGATALVCAIAVTSEVAGEVETGVGAGQSMIGTDGKVYVASATVCAAMGGAVAGSGVIP